MCASRSFRPQRLQWIAVVLLSTRSRARRECWEGFTFNYPWCCENPPWTELANKMCWGDDSGTGVFTWEHCCDIVFGPDIRYLPAWWTMEVQLVFRNGVQITMEQNNVQVANRNFTWDPAGVLSGPGPYRRYSPLYGVLWEDRTGRVMLSTNLLRTTRDLHGGRKLNVLDIASGLGFNVIAAAKSRHVNVAVGIDADIEAVGRAKRNAKKNGVEGTHFLYWDVCRPPPALQELLSDRVPSAPMHFDVITMSGLHAPPHVLRECAFELIFAMGGAATIYIDSDGAYFGPGNYYKHGAYPSFLQYAWDRGFPALPLGQVDVAALHDSDETPFLQILPVQLWTYSGRDFAFEVGTT